MIYENAKKIADNIVEQLKPHCQRIEIAGSIRRKKSEVKDIEIVLIPKPFETGLFESGIASIINKWQKVKGEINQNTKYTQRILPEGIKVDIFFANEKNWGLIFAIRTGSAEFSHKVLAVNWVKKGYKSIDGYLTKDGQVIFISEEKDLFDLLEIPYIEPEKRN